MRFSFTASGRVERLGPTGGANLITTTASRSAGCSANQGRLLPASSYSGLLKSHLLATELLKQITGFHHPHLLSSLNIWSVESQLTMY